MGDNAKVIFRVADMTCGHCVKSITNAIMKVVPSALVSADTTNHLVTVTGTQDADIIKQAIIDADYTPEII